MTDKNHTKFEEKELRFRQTLSALPDGVVLLRKDLVIQWMNRIAERDLSLDPEKDVGKKLTDVFTNPEFIQHIQSERWKARQLIDLPDGRVLEVRVISAGKKYTVVVTRDITESKRIDDFRRDFVGNVSHELRTPLTVIQGFLELATENPNLNEEDRLHWEMMLEQAERMRALVDDLLQIRCKTVGIDSGKQITANLTMRQDINQLLQPESLLPLESSTVFPVGSNIHQQLLPQRMKQGEIAIHCDEKCLHARAVHPYLFLLDPASDSVSKIRKTDTEQTRFAGKELVECPLRHLHSPGYIIHRQPVGTMLVHFPLGVVEYPATQCFWIHTYLPTYGRHPMPDTK